MIGPQFKRAYHTINSGDSIGQPGAETRQAQLVASHPARPSAWPPQVAPLNRDPAILQHQRHPDQQKAQPSSAFGFLHTTKQLEAAVAMLHNDVLPFYGARTIPISSILTDNGREFCGTETHPYELYLQLNDIEHRRTKVRRPQSNGFVERFQRTVLDKFFRAQFRQTLYESVAALQTDLDRWLVYYNEERPHQALGYCSPRQHQTRQLAKAA